MPEFARYGQSLRKEDSRHENLLRCFWLWRLVRRDNIGAIELANFDEGETPVTVHEIEAVDAGAARLFLGDIKSETEGVVVHGNFIED